MEGGAKQDLRRVLTLHDEEPPTPQDDSMDAQATAGVVPRGPTRKPTEVAEDHLRMGWYRLQAQQSSKIIVGCAKSWAFFREKLIMERKTIKKNQIKEFGGRMPRRRPRDKLGTSQGHLGHLGLIYV